jgi:hypothetical protein
MALPTQQFLEADQIREGIIILRNKALRGILMVSSLNFALKSDEEQAAIMYQFQNFLNSLDFSCQILIQSRRLNITGYLEKIKEIAEAQKNELLRIQTQEYYGFIKSLVETGTIMAKSFFVIVPFTIFEAQGLQAVKLLKSSRSQTITEEEFQRCKSQILQRMEFVALGLRRCGLKAIPLTTEEVIELFWSTHHPKEAEFGYYPEIPPEIIT